ncbi:hypothetical protein BH11BAC2_BH11BAC2_15380 [soil metagenome]
MNTTIKMVLDAWNVHIERTEKLFNELTDDQLSKEVAPGRNRGTYLLGHLIAVHDGMIALLSERKELFPQLKKIYLQEPDQSNMEVGNIGDLRGYWKEVTSALNVCIQNISEEEWFNRHYAVSEEAFTKEPHRNKLNIIINRTNHLSYHLGQLVFLKEK